MTKYQLAILGGGPAGVAASVYSARKKINSILITNEWGGQSNVSADVQNWIGFPHISGIDLAKKFQEHVEEYAGDSLDIKQPATITAIRQSDEGFEIALSDQNKITAENLFYGLGSSRRKLTVPGAEEFEHKGLTYCATCDGPLFTGKDVVVVGGGNAGFESAAQLLQYTKSVTLLDRGDNFRADQVTIDKLSKFENFRALNNIQIDEVYGDTFVQGIKYRNEKTGEQIDLPAQGIFVEIGMIPNTELVANLVDLDERKHIKIDPWTNKTSNGRIWAAGDCTNIKYHQNNIAAGDAVKAIENIFASIHAQ